MQTLMRFNHLQMVSVEPHVHPTDAPQQRHVNDDSECSCLTSVSS